MWQGQGGAGVHICQADQMFLLLASPFLDLTHPLRSHSALEKPGVEGKERARVTLGVHVQF